MCVCTSMTQGQRAISTKIYHKVTHLTFIHFIQILTSVRLAAMTVQGTQCVRIPQVATDAPVLEATVLIQMGRAVQVRM